MDNILENGSPRKWGVTDPISVSPPTPQEETVTASLMEELQSQGVFESQEEAQTR
jgi:poly(A) polymerase